ncbi:MAG TPA: SprT family zinc-dependent metalloprotease [bacterium]|nr:SprT family zinc-dependent metalloprotease [bacterium]HNS49368.1 SprT family zinc-dependent metalloprotease [bacterium]
MPNRKETPPAIQRIDLEGIEIEISRKRIRNLYLRVDSPLGRVRISAPARMSLEHVRAFARSRLDWIRRQQERARQRPAELPLRCLDGEIHCLWGDRYRLEVVETEAPAGVTMAGGRLILRVRPGAGVAKRRKVLDDWYRGRLRLAAEPLIAKWEARLGVKVSRLFLRAMKSRWGTCNAAVGSIRINTELARKPLVYLEYIVVHEMVHLLECSHNRRFKGLMDRFLPGWISLRAALNRSARE